MGKIRYVYSYVDLFIIVVCAYTIATLVSNLIPNIPLSRLFGMLIAGLTLIIVLHHFTRKLFLDLLMVTIIIIVSFIVSEDYSINLKDALWYLNTVLLIGLATNYKFRSALLFAISKQEKLLYYTIIFCDLILLMAIINPSSYGNKWNWGSSEGYFVGFAQNGHTLSSCSCLLLILIMTKFKGREMKLWQYILYFPPVYGIFFSGARTFLIPVAVLLLSMVFIKVKNRFHRLLLVAMLVIVFILVLLNSSMMDKFEFTTYNKLSSNLLSSISNGRSEFWLSDLKEFLNYEPLYLLFGKGFDSVYKINEQQYGLSIYAHNDFINCLVCNGIIGMIFYVCVWGIFVKNILNNTVGGNKLEFTTKVLFNIYVWSPMFLNGMFAYQHYVFSCVLLSVYFSSSKANDS